MLPLTIRTVGILGCGWLGRPLASKLLEQGIKVKGTTTSIDKFKELEALGISAYQIKFLSNKTIGPLKAFLDALDALIISIPPNYKDTDETLYNGLMRILNDYNLAYIQKIIYVSSTGVFEDGENCIYDEESTPNASSAKGQYLIKLENLFKFNTHMLATTVLRLSGLIKNRGRHPVYYLAGRKAIANPYGPVNLIEQEDAVGLIYAIITAKNIQPVYHGVFPWHPSRKVYYTQKARELSLSPPEFNETKNSIGKTISTEKTSQYLKFTFKSRI